VIQQDLALPQLELEIGQIWGHYVDIVASIELEGRLYTHSKAYVTLWGRNFVISSYTDSINGIRNLCRE
jgi:hypothetical protein